MSFAGLRNPPLCPTARAAPCAVVGGYMRGAGKSSQGSQGSQGGAQQKTLREGGCARQLARLLVSPFLAKPIQMSFAGLRNPPLCPTARARPCALVGGYMRGKDTSPCGGDVEAPPRHPSTAAFAGRWQSHFIRRRSRVVPYGSPGYRRLRRAPPQPRGYPGNSPGCAASGKTPYRRKGIPRVRRGVGYVGDWRFARPLSEPPGVPTRWGSRLAEPPGRASSWGA